MKVGKLFFNSDTMLNIDPGFCMSCRSQLDLSSAVAMSDRATSKINRYILYSCEIAHELLDLIPLSVLFTHTN